MSLKKTYTLNDVQRLIYESEGRTHKPSGPAGHTMKYHSDMRTASSDGRAEHAIRLGPTAEATRAMDPKDGFVLLGTDQKDVDGRFTTRLALIKAIASGLNSAVGQDTLALLQSGKPQRTCVAPLSPPVSGVERYTRATGRLERGLSATKLFLKLGRLGNGKTARLHLVTAYPTGF